MVEGLYAKYRVLKADGSPTDPNAQYFVLRVDADLHARRAVLAYADSVEHDAPRFAAQLRQWVAMYDQDDPKPPAMRMSEIGRIDFTALENQAATLGEIIDGLTFSSEHDNALNGLWNLCHAILDWKEKNP